MHPLRTLALAAMMLCLAAAPSRALTLLRDADIEYGLRQVATPVLQAAGLSPARVRILVIQDSTLNAFVADTQHIFIHSGLLEKLQTAQELQAVLAHEAAHIANGHLSRRLGNLQSMRSASAVGLALAAAATLAGGGEAAVGIAAGTQSTAIRMFLSHTRAEESSADQSSIRYLVRAGIDPAGAVRVMEIFKGQDVLSEARQDPYVRSHPLSRDRLRALEGLVVAYGKTPPADPTAEYWFERARGKLSGFTRAPGWTLRRADEASTKDIALMRKAAAYHRQADADKALQAINGAIALRPSDPFLLELKGQIQLESRRFDDAVTTYARASSMAKGNAMILGGYGRALLASGQAKKALGVLEDARTRDMDDPRILRDLAVAYAQMKQPAMASLVTAERYALTGRLDDAAIHAKRASAVLPQGSGPWRRAQDVLNAAKRAK